MSQPAAAPPHCARPQTVLMPSILPCNPRADISIAPSLLVCNPPKHLHSRLLRTADHPAPPLRPEENLRTCLTAAHAVLTFTAPDTATEALLDMVLLTPAQASALQSLLLHGSLLPQMLDYLLSRITRSAVPATESSMKVRTTA